MPDAATIYLVMVLALIITLLLAIMISYAL